MMADLPQIPADATAQALVALHSAPLSLRGWWDFLLALAVITLIKFLEVLPHLVPAAGFVVMALTILEKLIALGWIKNPKRRRKGKSDDAG